MAIEYKNSVLEITTSGSDQVVYTCPTSTSLVNYSAIVKTFTVFNTTAGAGTVDIQLTDTSASATHAIRHFDSTAYATKKVELRKASASRGKKMKKSAFLSY